MRDWLAGAPPGTIVPVEAVLAAMDAVDESQGVQLRDLSEQSADDGPTSETWRERLWRAPAETRLGANELCEALGRSKHWLYRHTGPSAENRIPHRKLDGELVFAVGEVRTWIRDNEEIVVAADAESTWHEMKCLSAIRRST